VNSKRLVFHGKPSTQYFANYPLRKLSKHLSSWQHNDHTIVEISVLTCLLPNEKVSIFFKPTYLTKKTLFKSGNLCNPWWFPSVRLSVWSSHQGVITWFVIPNLVTEHWINISLVRAKCAVIWVISNLVHFENREQYEKLGKETFSQIGYQNERKYVCQRMVA